MTTTSYMSTIAVNDGYNGHTVALHLCKASDGTVYGVRCARLWVDYLHRVFTSPQGKLTNVAIH